MFLSNFLQKQAQKVSSAQNLFPLELNSARVYWKPLEPFSVGWGRRWLQTFCEFVDNKKENARVSILTSGVNGGEVESVQDKVRLVTKRKARDFFRVWKFMNRLLWRRIGWTLNQIKSSFHSRLRPWKCSGSVLAGSQNHQKFVQSCRKLNFLFESEFRAQSWKPASFSMLSFFNHVVCERLITWHTLLKMNLSLSWWWTWL